MADWKQITARIRRARTGKDPAGQLAALFEKTRDAMVAFELARFFETSGQASDAAKWYVTAAERFRRADWKTKAQEAAIRLGADMSAASAGSSSDATSPGGALDEPAAAAAPIAEDEQDAQPASDADEAATWSGASEPQAAVADAGAPKRRRRGRRGGRNRRKSDARPESPAASPAHRESPAASSRHASASRPSEPPDFPQAHPRAIPALPVEPAPEFSSASVRGRSGDPGLSSRLSLLEMQLRRLLTCPPVKLSDADHAPVGPGVFVLTDSDLTSYYYVEACQTLRIAVGNLLRGGASRRGVDSIKPRLAEHLGIPESRVAKYLADHCVVRWLQLDEGASHFAHYVVAVIRPTLND